MADNETTKDQRMVAKLQMARPFPAGLAELSTGKYTLVPIPSSPSPPNESMLTFPYTMIAKEGGIASANPEEEAALVADVFAMGLYGHVKLVSSSTRGMEHHAVGRPAENVYGAFRNPLIPGGWVNLVEELAACSEEVAEPVCRASRAFNLALGFVELDPTLASLLLVVAGECLSSQNALIPFKELHPDGKTAERYARFISEWCERESFGDIEPGGKLAIEILKTAYYAHRSAYVHAGREVSHAVQLADKLNRPYVRHGSDQRPSPGLKWLSAVTGSAIRAVVHRGPRAAAPNPNILGVIARERSGVKLKVNRPIKAGEPVFASDFKLD